MRTYNEQDMIECYNAALINAIESIKRREILISATEYIKSINIVEYKPNFEPTYNTNAEIGAKVHLEFESKMFDIPAKQIDKPTIGIAVDCGSVNGKNPGIFEYRLVDIETKKVIVNVQVPGMTTNNLSEFLAIIHAIGHCIGNNLQLDIYSDSQTALSWVKRKKCKTQFVIVNEEQKQWIQDGEKLIKTKHGIKILFWNKKLFGQEIPADYGRK